MLGVVMGYALGLLHGMRHALEPDHVAAVSTFLAEQRSARSSVRFAVAWGIGHALMLLLVGGALFALRARMPERLADAFELVVAIMLVALGVRALVAAKRAASPHRHEERAPAHRHADHVHVARWTLARRPLAVGVVHGLAGSGALATMAMAELPTAPTAMIFMALYGAGATCGMAALAGIAGVPLAGLARRPSVLPMLMGATGLFSMALGVVWGSPILARWAFG